MWSEDLGLVGNLLFPGGMLCLLRKRLTGEQVFDIGVPEAPGSCRQRRGHADV